MKEVEKYVLMKVYVSFDGREFKTKKDCVDWESSQNMKKCPHCHGLGRIYMGTEKVFVEPMYRDLDNGVRSVYNDCKFCRGKGYILRRKWLSMGMT